MSSATQDLRTIYRQIVLEHSRQPRNQGRPSCFDREAEGHNRLCGDKVRVYLGITAERLDWVRFEASGCAICLASASLMTETVQGQEIGQAHRFIAGFEAALLPDGTALKGDLAALSGVSQYPSRVRCATLPWKTLRAALDAAPDSVTTKPLSVS